MSIWHDLTDMFNDGEARQEMVKKYKGTVLAITYNDKTSYGIYRGWDGDHFFEDFRGIKLNLKDDTQARVFVPQVERGLYNTPDGVVYACKAPYRQFKKGLCSDNMFIVKLRNFLTAEKITNPQFEYLRHVLTPIWYPSLDICFEIADEKTSVAVNNQYAIQLHHNKPTGYALFYHQYYIGDIDQTQIKIRNPIFYQEVLDSQASWCPNHQIILEA